MTLHEDKKKFHSAIQMAAAALKIKPHFVEKDYWICRSLQQMVRSDASHHAIFKGGTSLTKQIRIIERKSVMRNFFCRKAEFICICQKKVVSLHGFCYKSTHV